MPLDCTDQLLLNEFQQDSDEDGVAQWVDTHWDDVVELFETGSVTVHLGSKTYVLSLKVNKEQ